MRKDLFEKARAALLARRDEIIERREALERERQELVARKEPDWADTTSDQTLAGELEGLEERESAELARMLGALVRMDSGKWGKCAACGGDVDEARLIATPEASTCLACAAFEDRVPHAAPEEITSDAPENGAPAVEVRALEEPVVQPPSEADDRPLTARPKEKVAHGAHGSATLVAEQLARHVLEEATEAEVVDEEEEVVDAALEYVPDDTFPDRLGRPLDEIDATGDIAVVPRPKRDVRRLRAR